MLSPKQEQLVAALLTTPTVTGACRKVGVSIRTYNSWAHQPAFREAVRQAARDAHGRAGLALAGLSGRAAATLAKGMQEKASPSAIKAAVAVLDRAAQFVVTQDIEARLAAVERLLGGEAGGDSGSSGAAPGRRGGSGARVDDDGGGDAGEAPG
jgi:hypothetical protein